MIKYYKTFLAENLTERNSVEDLGLNAFLWRGSKIICPMSQLWGMSTIPASAVNYGLLAKFFSVSFPR
jgi:hypothetical protein